MHIGITYLTFEYVSPECHQRVLEFLVLLKKSTCRIFEARAQDA